MRQSVNAARKQRLLKSTQISIIFENARITATVKHIHVTSQSNSPTKMLRLVNIAQTMRHKLKSKMATIDIQLANAHTQQRQHARTELQVQLQQIVHSSPDSQTNQLSNKNQSNHCAVILYLFFFLFTFGKSNKRFLMHISLAKQHIKSVKDIKIISEHSISRRFDKTRVIW